MQKMKTPIIYFLRFAKSLTYLCFLCDFFFANFQRYAKLDAEMTTAAA